jgi:AcrR family transcriptional regulator
MERARTQILVAAADLVTAGGPRAVTMASVARGSSVAKATVYNHFRDRDDVLHALLKTEADHLVTHCAAAPTDERLQAAALWLSSSPVIDGLRRHDPATLMSVANRAAAEPAVHEVVSGWCTPDHSSADALRWLVSFAVVPGEPGELPSGGEASL